MIGAAALTLPLAELHAEEMTYFVIPAVGTAKNDGTDVGVIVPFIFADEEGRVTKIIAPMYINNEFLGNRGTINLFWYPVRGDSYKLIASYTEVIERKFMFDFQRLLLSGGKYSLEGNVGFYKNATARFYGIGPETAQSAQTNYTDRELLGHITGGIYVGPGRRVMWTERLRNVEIQPGGITDLPFTQSVFPA